MLSVYVENVQILTTGTAAQPLSPRSVSVATPKIILAQGSMGKFLIPLDYKLLWGRFMCIVCTEHLDLVKCLHMLQGVVIGTQAKKLKNLKKNC